MPANHISLANAKQWAKRLHADPHHPTPKLSSAQALVARMLGFADWHALEQACADHVPPAASPGEVVTVDAYFEALGVLARQLYPALEVVGVQGLAVELGFFDEMRVEELAEQAERWWGVEDWMGHLEDAAKMRALAPKGYLWVHCQVRTGTPAWVLVPQDQAPRLQKPTA